MTEDLDKKQLVRNLGEHYTSVFEEVIRDVLTSYRPWFAHKVAQRLKGLELGSVSAESVSEAQDWQGIESMSRLRSVAVSYTHLRAHETR